MIDPHRQVQLAQATRRWKDRHPEEHRSRRNAQNRRRHAEAGCRIDAIKMASGCVDCGYRADPVALQFDHVRGQKLAPVASLRRLSWDRVLAEIAKCEVRCANCHLIKTHRSR